MSRYKIGDKIRLRPEITPMEFRDDKNQYFCYTPTMQRWAKEKIIFTVKAPFLIQYELGATSDDGDKHFSFLDEWVKPAKDRIVILP